MEKSLKESALEYHRHPTPGKISVQPTKAMATQRDLSLAYSPGVADACMAIFDDPKQAELLTSRANLVARGIIPVSVPRFAEPQPFPAGGRFVADPPA